MDGRIPSFMKVLLEDFDTKLDIPVACTEILESIPSNVIIRTQKGSWAVKVEKKLNEPDDSISYYLLGHGWADLVKQNELRKGDILVFSLLDRTQFYLFAFGKTSCLKKLKRQKQLERASKKTHRRFAQFEVTLKRFNLFGLNVPAHFVQRTGMKRMKKVMVRDCEGREFSVKVNPEINGGLVLGDGWGRFVKQNGLESGMTCVIQSAIQDDDDEDADDPVLIVNTIGTI